MIEIFECNQRASEKPVQCMGIYRFKTRNRLLLIKDLSIPKAAEIRGTKPGNIKSQCSSVCRKVRVNDRNELAVYFVEDLLAGLDLTESGLNSTDETSDNSSQVGTSYLTAAMLNSLL